MAKRIRALVLAAALLCAGCSSRYPEPPGWPVVSRITVVCHQDGSATQKVFTSQEKMRIVLNKLRTLGQQYAPPTDPETLTARTFSVTVTRSDGSQRHYQTKGDRYIRTDENPWQQCDPNRLEELNQLLRDLPGDQ